MSIRVFKTLCRPGIPYPPEDHQCLAGEIGSTCLRVQSKREQVQVPLPVVMVMLTGAETLAETLAETATPSADRSHLGVRRRWRTCVRRAGYYV